MWSEDVERSASGLAFRRTGHGGLPVVLLHGIPGSAVSWRLVADLLPSGLDVIVPDLLGFGASARPTDLDALHAGAQAAALDGLLDELDLDNVTLIGHDFGGPVALALMARRPAAVSSLGLLATNAFADTPIPFPLSMLTWPILGRAAAGLLLSPPSLTMMLRRGVGTPDTPIDTRSYLGDRRQQRAIATIFAGSLTRLAELYAPIEQQLHAVDVPVLAAWGDRDPFFSVALGERTAHATGTRLRIYPGAGHFLPEERPHRLAEDIASLLARSTDESTKPRRPPAEQALTAHGCRHA